MAMVTEKAKDATLRTFSGYTMKRAFHRIQTDLNLSLEPLGLRMLTFSALVVVVDNPGLRQSQLAKALLIERPNMVLLVDELERAGLIVRNPAEDDRRAYALTPTSEGRAVYAEAVAVVAAHEKRMTAGLSEEQRQALIAALKSVESPPTEET